MKKYLELYIQKNIKNETNGQRKEFIAKHGKMLREIYKII